MSTHPLPVVTGPPRLRAPTVTASVPAVVDVASRRHPRPGPPHPRRPVARDDAAHGNGRVALHRTRWGTGGSLPFGIRHPAPTTRQPPLRGRTAGQGTPSTHPRAALTPTPKNVG